MNSLGAETNDANTKSTSIDLDRMRRNVRYAPLSIAMINKIVTIAMITATPTPGERR